MKSSAIPAELFFESEPLKNDINNKIVVISHFVITGDFLSLHHLEGIYRELNPHTLLVLAVLTYGHKTRGKKKTEEVPMTFSTVTQSKVFKEH